MQFNNIAVRHFEWVAAMGWHNKTVLESLALIASEIGEALVECDGARPSPAFGEELTDIVLRTVDLARWQGYDIDHRIPTLSLGWKDKTPQGALSAITVDLSKAVNACRGAEPLPVLADHLCRILMRVESICQWQGIDLQAEVERKMAINLKNGTRGRRV